MSPETIQEYDQRARLLEELTPATGGEIVISSKLRHRTLIVGNRIGLIRLAAAILRYAISARPQEGKFKAEPKWLKNFFSSPSETTTLIIQLDETPRFPNYQAIPNSLFSRVVSLLFSKGKRTW